MRLTTLTVYANNLLLIININIFEIYLFLLRSTACGYSLYSVAITSGISSRLARSNPLWSKAHWHTNGCQSVVTFRAGRPPMWTSCWLSLPIALARSSSGQCAGSRPLHSTMRSPRSPQSFLRVSTVRKHLYAILLTLVILFAVRSFRWRSPTGNRPPPPSQRTYIAALALRTSTPTADAPEWLLYWHRHLCPNARTHGSDSHHGPWTWSPRCRPHYRLRPCWVPFRRVVVHWAGDDRR